MPDFFKVKDKGKDFKINKNNVNYIEDFGEHIVVHFNYDSLTFTQKDSIETIRLAFPE